MLRLPIFGSRWIHTYQDHEWRGLTSVQVCVLFQRLSVDTVELGFGIQSAGVCLGEAGGEDCAGG